MCAEDEQMTNEWLTKWSKLQKTKLRAAEAQQKLFDVHSRKLGLGPPKSTRGRGRRGGGGGGGGGRGATTPMVRGSRGSGKVLATTKGDE